MPIYEYQAVDESAACDACRTSFEHLQRVGETPLETCPACGARVRKLISAPAVGRSQTGFDDRAKSAGFHKLKRLGHGEFEKQY
jgi:putative FmdB family regulatory protein